MFKTGTHYSSIHTLPKNSVSVSVMGIFFSGKMKIFFFSLAQATKSLYSSPPFYHDCLNHQKSSIRVSHIAHMKSNADITKTIRDIPSNSACALNPTFAAVLAAV